ncbi:TIGR03564 family F420-dependent LLM class oxidoreductase [Actinomadura sp. NAK00032]|uniref:TIGR03564 family F420-dependent LLM class oxidoreductase n=1 Tax=Actinomadura sp. NAK00032 TaxID=2742128 RepID=UPI0020C8276D|nr:TIGR03564 family F420-dependent LLM class oxidoreductase [Actinomadura sp. NAK00032]
MMVGGLQETVTAEHLIRQVGSAAEHGLSGVWAAQAFGWDALTALTLAGTAAPGIELGTAVVPAPQRHPLVLAGQALSVQAATGNRLTLGLGAGISMMVTGMYGLPADRPAARMREYLSVLRPLLRGEAVSHQSETLTAVGQVSVPGTTPPILLAALAPAMLRLAGELADGTVTWMTGPRTLADHIVPSITRAAQAAGRPAPRVVAGLLVSVTADAAGVRDRVAEQFGLAGHVPEYRAVLDREQAAGPQNVVIAGDEAQVERQLRRLRDAGVTDVLVAPFGSQDEQDHTIEVVAALAAADHHNG